MDILKLINPQMVAAQIVCFFLVFFLLKKFLWKPVFTVMEERRTRVQAELKAVEDAKLAVVVTVDEPHPAYYGGVVSGPVFKEVVQDSLRYLASRGKE